MCAWRYSAGSNNAGAGSDGGAPSTSAFGTTGQSYFLTGLSGNGAGGGGNSATGAFLRQSTGGLGGADGIGTGTTNVFSAGGFTMTAGAAAHTLATVGQQRAAIHTDSGEDYEDEQPEQDEEVEEQDEYNSTDRHRGGQRIKSGANAPPPPPASPPSSLATALKRTAPTNAATSANSKDARDATAAAAANAKRSAQLAESLSRQLFKAPMKGPVPAAPPDEDEAEEEGFDLLSLADQEFVRNTRDLFDDVDPGLLSEDFVPHEHVVGIIADDVRGNEATASQIEENLEDYKGLQEEIDAALGDYIEAHHEEFNDAIGDFSEMVLAVSGSDDTLAQFKKELADAVGSLESHAEELKVLRLRAAKSLFMAEALGSIQNVVAAETEVKLLVQGRHYLKAVQQLQDQAKLLASDELKGVRAIQTLRDAHNSTVASLHLPIIDDLLSCVFRQERLLVSGAELLQGMLDSSEQLLKDTNASAPSVQHTVHKYWKIAGLGEDEGDEDGVATGVKRPAESNDARASGTHGNDEGAYKASTRKERTLAAIIETLYDDPNDPEVASNYLRFVPLCVKSLLLLGKMDYCHETFFSRATKNIERFIAHFLRLYDAWRRRSRGGATLGGGDQEAAIRGTYVCALDLANDLISFDEAVATIQARDLRVMLGALFTELEKILRNAEYLQKIVLAAHFPFISNFIVQPEPFDAEATSRQWNLMDIPLRDAVWLHDTLSTALDYTQKILKETPLSPSSSSAAATTDDSAPNSQLRPRRRNSISSSRGGPALVNPDAADVMAKFLDFFSIDALLAPLVDPPKGSKTDTAALPRTPSPAPMGSSSTASGAAAAAAAAAAQTISPLLLALYARNRFLTLRTICDAVDAACSSVRSKYPFVSEPLLSMLALVFLAELRDAVRVKLVAEVQTMQQAWDLQVLWAQLNYHIESVFYVLCDAKETQEDVDDAVTLLPFLRQKNLVSRVQRTALIMQEAERQGDDTTLDRLLSTFESSGLLRMLEETGTVSFSLVGAVKKAQADIRKANEGQQRQHEAMQSDTAKLIALTDSGPGSHGGEAGGGGAVGSAGPSMVQLRASMLRRWFVFTAMNAVTCYECAARFYSRSCDRVPEFRLLSEEDCVVGFFKRFLRATYIPTLHAFHSQQLQALCLSIGDNVGGDGTTTSAAPQPPSTYTAGESKPDSLNSTPPISNTPKPPASLNRLSGAWPTVAVDGAPFPILACVQYVGQVLEKISDVRRVLPESLTDEVEQSTSEALIMELAVFLKRQVQWLGRGTLAHHLLDQAFEDAFAGLPNRKWAALIDEENMDQAHRFVDEDLQRYYQLNSEERTSGHEYNDTSALSMLQATTALDATSVAGGGGARLSSPDGGGTLDPLIGRMEPRDICMRDDSTLVAFALLCTSAEWLCDALLRHLWPVQRYTRNNTDCCVPGYKFSHEMRMGDTTSFSVVDGDYTAQHKIRLSGYLTRLCSIAQVSLFHLSVEARFLAFLFLPQLRDVSYDLVAVSSAADNFVQAYARRVHSFYAIMRQHLSAKKIKFTCLTAGRPASELVLCELAHLRYKAISSAGLMRLRTDLLVMQTTLQLILPADSDVRETVSRDFLRPSLFLRYIFNKDVVNEILSSLDYHNFSNKEIEVLIRLVFRQVSGANDDTLATQHIKFFYKKLQTIENFHNGPGATANTSANVSTIASAVVSPRGGAVGKASPEPSGTGNRSSVNATGVGTGVDTAGRIPPLAPPPKASVDAAAVVAAALNDDNDAAAEDEDEVPDTNSSINSAAPPLPLLSSAQSCQKTAAVPVLPATATALTAASTITSPPPPPAAAVSSSGEEEEETEEEDDETPERVVGFATRRAITNVGRLSTAGTRPTAPSSTSQHADPAVKLSPPPRPVVPPLASDSMMAAKESKPLIQVIPVGKSNGGVRVESSDDEEYEYEEYEYEEEETEEEEEIDEEEEQPPPARIAAASTAPRRAPAPRLPVPRQPQPLAGKATSARRS